MKKYNISAIGFGLALSLILSPPLYAKKSGEKANHKETCIDVPVRVFEKERLVEHLAAEDFRVFAEKKPLRIKEFQIKKKRMKAGSVPLSSRSFVLSFKVYDFNQQLKNGLRYVFDEILMNSDQLLVCANMKTLHFDRIGEKNKVCSQIERLLKEESQRERNLMEAYWEGSHKYVKDTVSEYHNVTQDIHPHYHMRAFANSLKRYLDILSEYKKMFLLPGPDSYYKISRLIDKTTKEKWLIHFYQKAVFPELSVKDRSNILNIIKSLDRTFKLAVSAGEDSYHDMIEYSETLWKRLRSIDDVFDIDDDFPAEEMSRIFNQIGATFHAISMEPESSDFSPTPLYKSTHSEIGRGFREIAQRTGGCFVDSSNLESALETISNKEDVLYLLTCPWDNRSKNGEIKVEVSSGKYELVYDADIRADYIDEYFRRKKAHTPDVQIKNLSFKEKKLSFEIQGFFLKKMLDECAGKINIRVVTKDKGNQVIFDQTKTLVPQKNKVTISIDFGWLKKGNYTFSVEVNDLITEKAHLMTLEARINQ